MRRVGDGRSTVPSNSCFQLTGNQKAIYQPWNEEEFQADLFVRKMNKFEKWIYRTLLQAMFFHTTRPYLPKDDDVLWMLADCDDVEEWNKHKAKVLRMFSVEVVAGREMLAHKRVLRDWQRLLEKREALAERGRSGGLAKAKRESSKEVKVSEVSKESKGSEKAMCPQNAQTETLRVDISEAMDQIGHLYPGNKHLSGRQLPNIQERAIAKAIREDGADAVLHGVMAFAEAVKNGYNFIPAAEKFFGPEKHYLKDPSAWKVEPKAPVYDPYKLPPPTKYLTIKDLAENMGMTVEEMKRCEEENRKRGGVFV